ncbi:MAG: MotA/TolQ/ExbB proton channel family protein [Alphaproteobacteria bacterium]
MTQVVQKARAFVREYAPQERVKVVPCAAQSWDGPATPDKGLGEGYPHLLVLRFAVFNLSAFALLGAVYIQGWVNVVIEADVTGLSLAIFGVFLGGLGVCAGKIWKISRELDCVRNTESCSASWAATYLKEVGGRGSGSRGITADALRVKLANRIAVVRQVAASLVLLGLIGTVLGFVIALSGVNPETAGDVRAIAPMVTALISGMSVALYTTLVGAVLHLWLMVNYRFLAGGAVKLATSLVSLGEANAEPRPD